MNAPEPSADRPPPPPLAWEAVVILGGGLLLFVAFFVGAHLLRPRISLLDRATGSRLPSGPYIGTRACLDCHPGEYAHFTRSGHFRSFQKAAESKYARRLVGRTVADQ